MAMTTFRNRVLLFGGVRPGSLDGSRAERFFADTWTLGGTGWHKMRQGTRPPARAFASTAWDAGRERTVVFAGWDGSDTLGDTWTLHRQP
jgi:hypothetical protein